MNYFIVPVTSFLQNCSIIWCKKTKIAAVIDPGGDVDKIKQEINNIIGLKITQIILTHGHIDHVGAATEISKLYNVPIVGPGKEDIFWLRNLKVQSSMFGFKECKFPYIMRWLKDGDILNIGDAIIQVLACPGHTPGHIVLFNRKSNLLISGDVIFNGGIGRSDFPFSNHTTLIKSIRDKILQLGDQVKFIPGHGKISTIGHERLYNPFLQALTGNL